MLVHLHDFAFNALYAALFGVCPQILRVSGRIKVIGITDLGQHGARVLIRQYELVLFGADRAHAEIFDDAVIGLTAIPEPILMKIDPIHIDTVCAEWMEVRIADLPPILKFDPELERAVRRFQKLLLWDSQKRIEINDIRDCRFTNTNRPDQIGRASCRERV